MKRARSKKGYPGLYEATAGGSALKGEAPIDCIKRELREETGIQADALAPAFEITWPGRHAIYHGYVCRYAGDKEAITLQRGETVAYRWLTLPELLAFMNDPTFVATSRERWGVYLNTLKEAELK